MQKKLTPSNAWKISSMTCGIASLLRRSKAAPATKRSYECASSVWWWYKWIEDVQYVKVE